MLHTQEVTGSSPVAPTIYFQKFPEVAVSAQTVRMGGFGRKFYPIRLVFASVCSAFAARLSMVPFI